ncbi:hypothetical protein [Ruminococcus sp.]|uniref:hypothetical protein n=1 Tax=Ruminococcus sp. TaxID=41978 RepID=UPI0025CBB4E5|nr:hypothetical protein [Ruminococcus sp.]
MKKKKKYTVIISSIISVMLIVPLIAFAILYKSGERKNVFRPAKANVQVRENNKSIDTLSDRETASYTWTQDTGDNNQYSISKSVQIYDVREHNDEYLRVRFVPMWYDSDGNICGGADDFSDYSKIELENNELKFKNSLDNTLLTLKLYTDSTNPDWSENWEYDSSNECFYYKGKITSGDISETLLSGVKIPKSVYESTTEYNLHIEVLADAVQTGGNAKQNRWE